MVNSRQLASTSRHEHLLSMRKANCSRTLPEAGLERPVQDAQRPARNQAAIEFPADVWRWSAQTAHDTRAIVRFCNEG